MLSSIEGGLSKAESDAEKIRSKFKELVLLIENSGLEVSVLQGHTTNTPFLLHGSEYVGIKVKL